MSKRLQGANPPPPGEIFKGRGEAKGEKGPKIFATGGGNLFEMVTPKEVFSQGPGKYPLGLNGGFSGKEYNGRRSEAGLRVHPRSLENDSGGPHNKGETIPAHLGVYPRLVRGGSRKGTPQSSPFLLLPNVFGSEGGFTEKTYNRPFRSQQVSKEEGFQNGGPGKGSQKYFAGSLGSEGGLEGCILPHPSRPRVPEVFCVCPRGANFLLPGPPFWSLFCPMGIHKGYETHQGLVKAPQYQGVFLPGRFPHPGPFLSEGHGAYLNAHRPPTKVGVQSQLGEIFSGTPSPSTVSGSHCRPGVPHFFPSRGKSAGGSSLLSSGTASLLSHEKRIRKTGGIFQFRGKISGSGETLLETNSSLDEHKLLRAQQGLLGSSGRCSEGGPAPLGRSGFPKEPSSYKGASTLNRDHDRCLRFRVERDPPPRDLEGGVASSSPVNVNQLEGTQSNSPNLARFSSPAKRQMCQSVVGQQNSLILHQEARFLGFSSSLGPLEGDPLTSKVSRDILLPNSSKGEPQRPSRQSFQGHHYQYRVDSGSSIFSRDLRENRFPSGGSVRHKGEHTTGEVCLPLSGPTGSDDRCSQLRLERVAHDLCVSPYPASRGGDGQAEFLQGKRLPDSSPLANSQLVCSARGEMCLQVSTQERSLPFPGYEQGDFFPSRQGNVSFQASRLDTIDKFLRGKGLSAFSRRLIKGCHKPSTIHQYQGVWTKFLDYLETRDIRHKDIQIGHVLNFLSFHIESFDRAYKTIAAYKAALCFPLEDILNLNLGCALAQKFMRGFFLIKPPPRKGHMPTWDLSDLLLFLRDGPFEPLESVSPKKLLQKTLALLLLASGRRISELAALSRHFRGEGRRTFLLWFPGFTAKWENKVFRPEDPSFLRMSSPNERDRLNCPFRAWKIFCQRRPSFAAPDDTRFWTKNKSQLSDSFKDLVKSSRRFWGLPSDVSITTHQSKKFAASYCKRGFRNIEKSLPLRLGNKGMRTLNSNYISRVPSLRVTVTFPLGTLRGK